MCKSRNSLCLIFMVSILLSAGWSVQASTLVPQTPLPGGCIPKFITPLPVFGPAGPIPRVNSLFNPRITVNMKEINQAVLPPVTINTSANTDVVPGWPALPPTVTFGNTRVCAYEIRDTQTNQLLGPAHWPAVTVTAQRGNATTITYVNQLPSFDENNPLGPGLVQGLISVDKTIHWADPLNSPMMNPCMDNPLGVGPDGSCNTPYIGPIPAVPHLHGGEVSSLFDGGPEAWFTPNGLKGPGYYSLYSPGAGKAIYKYPNLQESGTLWFHDHALGATRTNVYSGLAAFYFLNDLSREPQGLPGGAYDVEMAIQDRQFDINSQLFFPDGSPDVATASVTNLNGPPGNPTIHPFWIPEFMGDVVVVNGAPWPKFQVEPRRYRLRLLNGSNARMYVMHFGDVGEPSPPVYCIGADDNYLNSPVNLTNKTLTFGTNTFPSQVFFGPGERIDLIVDFTGLTGKNVTLVNFSPAPFPEGLWPVPHNDPVMGMVPADPGQSGMHYVMQFQVTKPMYGKDLSADPAAYNPLKLKRPVPMVRLTDGKGNLAPGVVINKKRQLVLKEFEDPITGSPVIVLVNNTYWDGTRSPSIAADFADGISELPRQGSTELWEIINLTMDEHPMHTHLTQFQVLNREPFDTDGTIKTGLPNPNGYIGNGVNPGAWAYAFGTPAVSLKCATFSGDPLNPCPGYGPPNDYLTVNGAGALGGNPDITPYLLGNPQPPRPEESGWKDTAKADPGSVLRIVVRWTPTSAPVSPFNAGKNLYSFDPTQGPGYVWHCHIIDHEDNEMMRPYKVSH